MTCEDSLLAATCLAGGHTLATNNARHFEPAKQFGLDVVQANVQRLGARMTLTSTPGQFTEFRIKFS